MILNVDPKVDYAFKRLFGRDSTRPILINLANAVLNPMPGHRIQAVNLLNPFNPKETATDKLSILDIKARDQSGRQLNLEMQMFGYSNYDKRVVYYGSRFHQQQLQEGEDYRALKPTISISFLNHVMFSDKPIYHSRFRLLEESHHFPLSDDLQFHVLELPKFTKSADELESDLDVWLYFLRHAETMDTDAIPVKLQQGPVLQAVEELKVLAQNDQERELYEARRKMQLDINTGMNSAREEGMKIGAIHFCERVLGLPQTPTEQLSARSLEDLTRLADQLQEQVLNRR